MRQAGTIANKPDAERFANYLLSLGITTKVEPSDGQWAIWIHDENQIPRSKQELDIFLTAPQDERYRAAEGVAKQVLRETAAREKQARKNYVDLRNEWAKPWRRRPITVGLIVVCVAFAMNVFQIPETDMLFHWPSILHGEVWRLIGPIFLHAKFSQTPFHLIFNMYMLYQIGSLIEWRIGSWRYALLVLAIALISNSTQYAARGPYFVGMSGVVFGLFGYAWVRGRLNPASGMYLPQSTVFWIMGWFVLCAVGIIPNVANWAHGGGLAAGAGIAYLTQVIPGLLKKA